MEKMASDGPKWGQEDFFPTNPDLANILGRTDFNFENFDFLILRTPDFWISRSQNSGFPHNLDSPTFKNLDFPASRYVGVSLEKKAEVQDNPMAKMQQGSKI